MLGRVRGWSLGRGMGFYYRYRRVAMMGRGGSRVWVRILVLEKRGLCGMRLLWSCEGGWVLVLVVFFVVSCRYMVVFCFEPLLIALQSDSSTFHVAYSFSFSHIVHYFH